MNTTNTTLPSRLKAWRSLLALTQEQAAHKLSVPVDTFRTWEQGKRNPNASAVSLIERVIAEQQNQQTNEREQP